MKLHEAITAGIEARPKAARGVYFSGEDKSDVLGAAYQGVTGKTEVNNHEVKDFLDQTFPILAKKVSHPKDGKIETLKAVLLRLNDESKWKRKNIARFVESLENRMDVGACSEGGTSFPSSRE